MTDMPKSRSAPEATPEPEKIPEGVGEPAEADTAALLNFHFLDMGKTKFGDCIMAQIGRHRILIDGGHPGDWRSRTGFQSIPQQLGRIFKKEPPYRFNLLIVTHAHLDHIGCLPTLVETGQITADWALVADPDLGWSPATDAAAPDLSETQRRLMAALREESYSRERDDAVLLDFIADAGGLQDDYRRMLKTLEDRGTRIVTFLGSDDDRPEYRKLLDQFDSTGLQILGPTRAHLQICADRIDRVGRDALDAVTDATSSDGGGNLAEAYRRLSGEIDASGGDLGAALNDQSILTLFKVRGRKILLTGDMQLADPQIRGLEPHIKSLREAIRREAPFDLYKIAHHASHNALDAEVLADLGETRLLVFSTGRDEGDAHPAPEVMRLLRQHQGELEWARTDRNELISFSFSQARARINIKEGSRLNDDSLNGSNDDLRPEPARPPAVPPAGPALPPPAAAGPARAMDPVEVITRIPYANTRVTVTIEVQPLGSGGANGPSPVRVVDRPAELPGSPRLAGGRPLPPLLFVTSSHALGPRIGTDAAARLVEALGRQGAALEDLPAESLTDAATAARSVQEALRRRRDLQGVVLIGGYDVLPSQRFDALDPELRAAVQEEVTEDPDDFLVWSDDVYADLDGNRFPELPVSRIPDGGSASLLWAALQAGPPSFERRRSGLRNSARPFAEQVFQRLPGPGDLLASTPVRFDRDPPQLAAERVYLMLHGDHQDATRFWGEGEPVEAVNVGLVPDAAGAVVFSGCCWGALPVVEPAVSAPLGEPVTPHNADSSIALRFLHGGANAFVGCTGAHYSPLKAPFSYFGGPLHEAFWSSLDAGQPPARALWEAKVAYLDKIPHGRPGTASRAIEHKILRQFTCLGLGW
jgi:beta-lactamase superfamily II metal-dependent hydrolase